MQTVSSYGVEIRKQNIPIRQTLKIYRQAVSYLTEIYEQVWAELKMIPEAKKRFNAAEHLVHTTKKNHAHLVLTSVFRRCLLISGELPSSMHWEVYRPMKAGWNSGRQRENSPGNRILPVKTMPCRSFTGM